MQPITVILLILSGVVLLLLLYAALIAPRIRRPEGMSSFLGRQYAHRGLHDIRAGVPENTLLAFARAVDNGYGMEFDVRFTKDGQLVVMHDDDLERMTGTKGRISEMTIDQISRLRVGGTDQPIPRFQQVLDLIDGRVPLIIELKVTGGNYAQLADEVCRVLDDYSGPYVIESFDPRLVRWLRRHRPEVIRGQLLEFYRRHGSKNVPAIADFVIHNQMLNCWVRPDFIATNYADRGSFAMSFSRKLFHTPEFDWTVPSQTEADRSRAVGAGYIFEGFIPRSHE